MCHVFASTHSVGWPFSISWMGSFWYRRPDTHEPTLTGRWVGQPTSQIIWYHVTSHDWQEGCPTYVSKQSAGLGTHSTRHGASTVLGTLESSKHKASKVLLSPLSSSLEAGKKEACIIQASLHKREISIRANVCIKQSSSQLWIKNGGAIQLSLTQSTFNEIHEPKLEQNHWH